MENVHFSVNTDALAGLVTRLEAVHRSALPLAIRDTLNGAAFDVKQKTLDQSATQNFIRRSPTFFKRFSGVSRATGYDITAMKSEVGMTDNGDQKAAKAIRNMEKQEEGGQITDGLDYLAAARTSGSLGRTVATKKRFNKDNVVKGAFKKKGSTKSRQVAAAYVALREGKYQKTKINGRNFYRTVSSISKTKKGKITIKSKLVYVSRNGTIKPVSATHFSMEAAERTQPKMQRFFNESAERQFARVWK